MKRCRRFIFILLPVLCMAINASAQKRNSLIIGSNSLILQIDLRSPKIQIDSILRAAGLKGSNDAAAILNGNYTALKNDGWMMTESQGNTIRFSRPLTTLNANAQAKPYLITTNISNNEDSAPGYPSDVNFGINRFERVTVHELPSGVTRFFLPGHLTNKRAMLSGNFNNWSTLKGVMAKTDSGWIADVKLAPGKYEYKFIVDGRWMGDKFNMLGNDSGFDNNNSIYFRYNYTFKLSGYPNARRITLAGSFNSWDANNIILGHRGNFWQAKFYLHEGTHAYRFLVDGKWVTDPANPNTIKDADGNINSVLNIGETVNFKLNGHAGAKKVYLAGTFNNWQPIQLLMTRSGTGWVLPLILPAGNYSYKFIADGEWMTDPANGNTAVNEGIRNSFIAVKPNHTFVLKGHANAHVIYLSGTFNNWDTDGYTLAHNGDVWTMSLNLKPGKYLYRFIIDGEWITDPANKLYEPNKNNGTNSVLWVE